MILRSSFSKAKKLFCSTLQTFKSMLSNGYQKLPKASPLINPFSCSSQLHHSCRSDLDAFHSYGRLEEDNVPDHETMDQIKQARDPWEGKRFGGPSSSSSSSSSFNSRLEACSAVTRRLKELELMDLNNADHVMDIEEVLHCYSRITCPFYVDIVNKYFMEISSEFLPQEEGLSRW